MQVTRQHRRDRLRQRHPGLSKRSFFIFQNKGAFFLRYLVEVTGEEDPEALGAETGRGEEVGEHLPVAGPVPGLLQQLASCCYQRLLSRHVTQAGRDLPQHPAYRMAVLPDHQNPVRVVQRQDRHRARVLHHRPFCPVVSRHTDPVGAYGDQLVAVFLRRRVDRPALDGVFHAVARAGIFSPDWACASAAAIRPLNNGCGRVGLDRNSGCACVATKNGCVSGLSSANSTR
jgi:hypothetical protein